MKNKVLSWNSFRPVLFLQILLALLVLISVGFGGRYFLKHQFTKQIESQMWDTLASMSQDLPQRLTDEWCVVHSRMTSFRLTVVEATSGKPLCDSYYPSKKMQSLKERDEIQKAIQGGYGQNVRFSTTLSQDMFYGAYYVSDRGIVLRAGIPLKHLQETLHLFNLALGAVLALVALVFIIMLFSSERFLIFPLAVRFVEKRTQDMRVDFVANVSHELRTPLTAIKGYTDTILLDLQDGRAIEKEFVEVIARNSSRLLALINDLLDLSTLDAHADQIQKISVDTQEITNKVICYLEGAFQNKSQKVQVEFLVPTVWADPGRLEQVLVNLVSNARKYTAAGGDITVRWMPGDHEGDVVLQVSDTGPGIAKEHHAKLFERFYRVDKARSREMGGTGLGLAIVKHIAENHGGRVWVESEVGQGSTFFCSFPGLTQS